MSDDVLGRLAETLGVAAPDATETQLLLDCAREVAHSSERRHAPLAAFLIGVAVGDGSADRAAAVERAVTRVRASLKPSGAEGPPAS